MAERTPNLAAHLAGRVLRSPQQGLLTFVLLCFAILTCAWALAAPNWVPGMDLLAWIAFAGLLAGLVLSSLRLPVLLLHFLGIGGGLLFTAWSVSSLIPLPYWDERLMALWTRFAAWLKLALDGGIGTDNLLFLLLVGSVAWFVGFYSAWTVFRTNVVWWSIITSGGILLVAILYYRDLAIHLIAYVVSALLLVSRFNYVKQQRIWRTTQMRVPSGLGSRVFQASLIVGLGVILAVWLAPTIDPSDEVRDALNAAAGPWKRIEAEFGRLFAGLSTGARGSTGGPFGSNLTLRGSIQLGSDTVMVVYSPESRYWRVATYDTYTGRGWLSNPDIPLEFPAELAPVADVSPLTDMHTIEYSVTVMTPRGASVFLTGQPLTSTTALLADVEPSTRIKIAPSEPSELPSEPRLVNAARAPTDLDVGTVYTVSSAISWASPQQLRQAGETYPPWITAKYLAMPNSVPADVRELARRLEQAQSNAYDKASAVELYLRQIPYTLDVKSPPEGKDAVSYFLFDAKKGYCDYYASSMVVLLRLMGVPSRVVSGYTSGTYDLETSAYVVSDADAHSWVEAWFPGYGWIEFEPTAARPLFVRPLSAEYPASTEPPIDVELFDPREHELPLTGTDSSGGGLNIGFLRPIVDNWPWFVATLALLIAIYAAVKIALSWGLANLPPSQLLYAKMCRLGALLGIRQAPSDTPAEYATRMTSTVPLGADNVREITDNYLESVFARREGGTADQGRRLTSTWKQLRFQLVFGRMIPRFLLRRR